jgi:hypothetical protein
MKSANLLLAGDASGNLTSGSFFLGDLLNYAVQAIFSSGTLNGTLKLQGSLDNTSWADIDNSSKSVTSGGGIIYTVPDCGYSWVRAVYTATSGTGTLTVNIQIKEIPHG